MAPHFRVPLNLPHACTISARIIHYLGESGPGREQALRLLGLLRPFQLSGENPPVAEADRVVTEAAALGRRLVEEIESAKAGHDRLGQAVRNLFECLELGEEGAQISLRAGEDPKSALRPI
jgi:hypothetical protein